MVRRLASRLERMAPAPPRPARVCADEAVAELRDWWMAETSAGYCHVALDRVPAPEVAKEVPLHELLGDQRLEGFRMDKALYLDIESTGLSHGAGNHAFLIGCAYFQGDEIVMEQLFMVDPTDEMPILARFLELVERHEYLVSFNGKSFDLSVLQSRLVCTRMMTARDIELKVFPHLDLLHTARAAYKNVFENTKLQTLEREVLKLDPKEREDDVAGSMIPALYFHYLRTGYAEPLDPVLRHNRTDVLSMVDLTAHLVSLINKPPPNTHGRVLLNLGRSLMRRRQNDRAAALLRRALRSLQLDSEEQLVAAADQVTALRRAGRFADAAEACRLHLALTPSWDTDVRGQVARRLVRMERRTAALQPPVILDRAEAHP